MTHRFQHRPRHGIRTPQGEMKVAGGERLGDHAWRRAAQEPESVFIDRRRSCPQVLEVILIVKRDVKPALDHRVAHDDADQVGPGGKQAGCHLPEHIESAQSFERPGHEADDACSRGNGSAGDRPPALVISVRGRFARPRRVDSVVLNPEIVAVFGGEKPGAASGWESRPDRIARDRAGPWRPPTASSGCTWGKSLLLSPRPGRSGGGDCNSRRD